MLYCLFISWENTFLVRYSLKSRAIPKDNNALEIAQLTRSQKIASTLHHGDIFYLGSDCNCRCACLV
jgi:hypothetical protein